MTRTKAGSATEQKRYRVKTTRNDTVFFYQRTIQTADGTTKDQWTGDPNAAAIFSTKEEAEAATTFGSAEEAPAPEFYTLPF